MQNLDGLSRLSQFPSLPDSQMSLRRIRVHVSCQRPQFKNLSEICDPADHNGTLTQPFIPNIEE